MKDLDQIFLPDQTSLDVRIGPYVVPGMTETEFHHVSLAKTHGSLSAIRCHATVPMHIQENIELSKNLLLYGTYVFDFTTAAVHYAQIALEASLRRALGKTEECRDNIDMMLKEAVSKNLLSKDRNEHVTSFGFVRHSRNGLSHDKENRNVFNHALAIPFVEMIVEAINALFPESASQTHAKG